MYWNDGTVALVSAIYRLEPKHRMYWNGYSSNICLVGSNLNRNIGCIETEPISLFSFATMYLEPKHRMYWNWQKYFFMVILYYLEPKHRMYWNAFILFSLGFHKFILNRNIGCIETTFELNKSDINTTLEPKHRMYWNFH